MTLTDTLDHLLSVFLRPLRTWIEREFVAPLRAAYDAAMQTKEQYRDGVYLHLRERLEGTDEHPLAEGVPVRPLPQVQDLEHLQEAVELLGERKIEDASPAIPDGVSLVRLLCDSSLASQVTEIKDTNSGWTWNRNMAATFNTLYPSLEEITIGCIVSNYPIISENSVIHKISMPNLVEAHTLANYKTALFNLPNLEEINLPNLEMFTTNMQSLNFLSNVGIKKLYMPKFKRFSSGNGSVCIGGCHNLEEIVCPNTEYLSSYVNIGFIAGCENLRKVVIGITGTNVTSSGYDSLVNGADTTNRPYLIHIEIGAGGVLQESNMRLTLWSPTQALRTDTTASDYIDLREDKDDSGEFINATNLEQFLANFRKYIILRVANRTGQTALTLTLSAAVYQSIYGLDSSNNADNNSWARTHTLADLGLTADDLTEAETAAGITINTIYATWLDTYRSAINWNIGH